MAGSDIPETLRAAVRERARERCEYCLTTEALSGIRCQVDHIVPRSLDGMATLENLCLACVACNGHKHSRTHAVDSESGTVVSLFNPRQQQWQDPFFLSAD